MKMNSTVMTNSKIKMISKIKKNKTISPTKTNPKMETCRIVIRILPEKNVDKSSLGYDRNRIIRQEPEPKPEFWFRSAGTGLGFSNSASG